jgi:hypothetical protein
MGERASSPTKSVSNPRIEASEEAQIPRLAGSIRVGVSMRCRRRHFMNERALMPRAPIRVVASVVISESFQAAAAGSQRPGRLNGKPLLL